MRLGLILFSQWVRSTSLIFCGLQCFDHNERNALNIPYNLFYILIDLKLVVVTVATKSTDGFKRFMRSCKIYNIDVKVFCFNDFTMSFRNVDHTSFVNNLILYVPVWTKIIFPSEILIVKNIGLNWSIFPAHILNLVANLRWIKKFYHFTWIVYNRQFAWILRESMQFRSCLGIVTIFMNFSTLE